MPGRSSGMMPSLRGGVSQSANNEQAAASNVPQQPEMNEPVDEPALRRTWKQFIQTIPEEKLLQTAILNSRVKLSEGTHINVTVGSDEQMQRINENKAPATAAPKVPLTPRERMAEMRKENPELIDELVNTFGLELS